VPVPALQVPVVWPLGMSQQPVLQALLASQALVQMPPWQLRLLGQSALVLQPQVPLRQTWPFAAVVQLVSSLQPQVPLTQALPRGSPGLPLQVTQAPLLPQKAAEVPFLQT
jgi:hypothetical protein